MRWVLPLLVAFLLPASAGAYTFPMPQAHVVRTECPDRADAEGCVDQEGSTIYAGRDCERICLAHEYGHVFDHRFMTDRLRARWATMVGRDVSEWYWTPAMAASYTGMRSKYPVEELFADSYSMCAIGRELRDALYWFGGSTLDGAYGAIPRRAVGVTCWLATHLR